jgi:hypothetical protein
MFEHFIIKLIAAVALLSAAIRVLLLETETVAAALKRVGKTIFSETSSNQAAQSSNIEEGRERPNSSLTTR